MLGKHKILGFLIVIFAIWFDTSSSFSEWYFGVETEDIHYVNGEIWLDLETSVDHYDLLSDLEQYSLIRRVKDHHQYSLTSINQAVEDILLLEFLFPLNTTRTGHLHTSKPKRLDFQEWLFLKYLF